VRTRREVMMGGLLSVAVGGGMCGFSDMRNPSGCLLSAQSAANLLGTAASWPSISIKQIFNWDDIPIRSSGNRQFDYALAQTLGILVDTLQVYPKFAFYDDHESPNAYAAPASFLSRFFSRRDGTVLLGVHLLNRLMSLEHHPEIAIAEVCAHEFGHIVQFKHGLMTTLSDRNSTNYRIELHADFLAGYFAGLRKVVRPSFPSMVFGTTAFHFGDYAFGSPEHHGSPEQREDAIMYGFKTGYRDRRSLSEALKVGIDYVRSV
jgi:hypothetical protein